MSTAFSSPRVTSGNKSSGLVLGLTQTKAHFVFKLCTRTCINHHMRTEVQTDQLPQFHVRYCEEVLDEEHRADVQMRSW